MSCDCSAPEDIFVIGCTALSGVSFPDGVAVPVVLCQCGWSFPTTGDCILLVEDVELC